MSHLAPYKTQMLAGLRAFIDRGNHGLYPQQVDALEAMHRFWELRKGSVIGNLPDGFENASNKKQGEFCELNGATGSGKTREMGILPYASGLRTLVCTPRNLINEQTVEEFSEKVGIPIEDIGIYDSNQSEKGKLEALEKQILVVSYQGLSSLLEQGVISSNPKEKAYRPLVILDETHDTAQGFVTSSLLEPFLDNCLSAGFTATDGGAHQTLFRGQMPIYTFPLVQAIEEGVLVERAKARIIDVNIDEEWLRDFQLKVGQEYPEELIAKLSSHASAIRAAIHTHFGFVDEYMGPIYRLPSIFSVHLTDAAIHGAQMFNEEAQRRGLDVRAAAIYGDMSKSEKAEIMAKFRAGHYSALWYDKYLGLGLNEDITVAHSIKISAHSVEPTQGFGRLTRKQWSDYFSRFGHNKVAIGFSYRFPDLYPYTFFDVLNGKPEVYSKQPSWVYEPTGEESAHVHLPDVKVHLTNAETIEVGVKNSLKREELSGKTPEDWITVQQASSYTGLGIMILDTRLGKIEPDKQYNIRGLQAGKNEETFLGADLVRKTSYRRIIKRSLAEQWKKDNDYILELIKQGYKRPSELPEIAGISMKAKEIEPDKEYNEFGRELKAGENPVKGAVIVYKNPYISMGIGSIYLHPKFIQALKERNTATATAGLAKEGYFTNEEAVELTGLTLRTIGVRARAIKQDGFYTPAGRAAQGEEAAIKGSELVRVINQRCRLIAGDLVEAWVEGSEKLEEAKKLGYTAQPEAAKIIGIAQARLGARTSKIQSEQTYIISIGEDIRNILGEDMVVRSDYSAEVYLHPDYVESMRLEEEQIKDLISKGYLPLSETISESGMTKAQINKRSNKIVPDLERHYPAFRPLYSSGIVYHPDFVSKLKLEKAEIDKECGLIAKLKSSGFRTFESIGSRHSTLNMVKTLAAKEEPRDAEYYPTYIPTTQTAEDRATLYHPDFVDICRGIDSQLAEKENSTKDTVSLEEAAIISGVKYATICSRIRAMDAKKSYTEDGLEVSKGYDGKVVLGEEIVSRVGKGYHISIKIANRWKAERELSEVLRGERGYKALADFKEEGLNLSAVRARILAIKPDLDYNERGLKPQPNEPTIKGSELVVFDRFLSEYLLRGSYFDAMVMAEREMESYRAQGYKNGIEVAEIASTTTNNVSYCAGKLEPERRYALKGGILQESIDGTKGSVLFHKYPYGQATLLHPDLVTHIANSEKKASTFRKGATAERVGAVDEAKLPEGLRAELRKKLTYEKARA